MATVYESGNPILYDIVGTDVGTARKSTWYIDEVLYKDGKEVDPEFLSGNERYKRKYFDNGQRITTQLDRILK